MAKVSIIMPVYNVEKYVSDAIDSVLKQIYNDFELLLINDGSTDSSWELCKEYGKKDDRIVLLENNSENHGPGSTRNIGLDHAIGEYIYFMDADDWIDRRLLECAVKRIQETKADIVKFGAVFEKGDRVHSQPYCWNGKDIMTKDEIKKNILNFWKENMNTLWVHLFRRETIKEIRFENMINGEDISYVVDALCYAEKIAYIKEAFYHYRYVEGSTSHHWSKNAVQCRGIIWNHQRKLLESFQNSMDPLVYASLAYDNYNWAIYQLSARFCPLTYSEKKRELVKLKEFMGFDKYRKNYPLKMEHGIMKVKMMLIKYHLEGMIVFLGPLYYRIVNGE